MATHKEQLAFLEELHTRTRSMALELLELPFDRRTEGDGYLVSLYGSIIELVGAIVVLTKADQWTCIGAVSRTLLEAFVNLKLVAKDRAYVQRFIRRHHEDWLELLGPDGEGNPYLADIHNHEWYDEALERHQAALDELTNDGILTITAKQRFVDAEMSAEHFVVYRMLCGQAHNDWQALIRRHWTRGGDQDHLVLFRDRTLEEYDTHVDMALGLLIEATKIIHEQLNPARLKEIADLEERSNDIRAPKRKDGTDDGRAESLGTKAENGVMS